MEAAIRVLVVDDFASFRNLICSLLHSGLSSPTIFEAYDGIEAVALAQEHQPSLIILDIGLPSINGFDAARQIRELSPHSRLLFVTQETGAEMVGKAFGVGGMGYVAKNDVGRELLAAVSAAMRGDKYVSRGASCPSGE